MDVELEVNENDSSEDADDSDNEEALEKEVQTLESKVTENIFDYQAHLNLLEALKKLVDLERLRKARNRMSEQFPLAPNLWLEWLEDEIKLATSPEEKEEVASLFERSVKDYLSVDIWLEYVQFNIGMQAHEDPKGLENVRSLFERALTSAGLHVTKGTLLWEAYIEYEIIILATLKGKNEQEHGQLKRIANLFKRQLSCPLVGIEETFERFSMWLDDNVASTSEPVIDKKVVENIYKTSKEKLSKINPFEEKLVADNENLLEYYKEYLEHEKSKAGSPVRVLCLYERAVCDLCLIESLWLEYAEYINNVLKNAEVAVDVCKKAIRNCPWSCRIHQTYLLTLEQYGNSREEITGAMEQALTSGFQIVTDYRDLWMTYLEYLRRYFDAPDISKDEEKKRLGDLLLAFDKASKFVFQLEDADVECTILQFWARIEAIYCKNLEKSRSLWGEILSDERNKTAEMWMEYINVERAYGDSKHLRKLFPRALQNTKDWPENVSKCWLNYERDEGTLESYLYCVGKIKARLKQVTEQREKEKARQAEELQMKSKRPKKAGLGYKEKNEKYLENEPKKITGYKRKQETEPESKDVSPIKKPKPENDEYTNRNEAREDIVQKLLEEKAKEKEHGVTVVHDSSKDDRTVFVSNLDFSTEESKVRELFSECGAITDLRLVKDYKGRSKGYSYVEFEKPKDARKAILKDRELINGRPAFVSKCDPDKQTRESGFKYKTSLEKNKLFIKGLPHTTTKEDIENLFSKYGTVKDVRLVTFRNGHSKGLAYVDYEDEVSAAQAIIKTDGMKIEDREISVALSNPPIRKNEPSSITPSLGGGPKESGPRGRSRTQISFLPRSLQLNQQPSATNSMAKLCIKSPPPTDDGKKLSNVDFRNLLH